MSRITELINRAEAKHAAPLSPVAYDNPVVAALTDRTGVPLFVHAVQRVSAGMPPSERDALESERTGDHRVLAP